MPKNVIKSQGMSCVIQSNLLFKLKKNEEEKDDGQADRMGVKS